MKLLIKLICIPALPAVIAFYSYGQSPDTILHRYIASIDTVISRVNAQYVYPPALEKLTRRSIDAVFEGLDPFSYFMSPEEAQEFRVDLNSKFGGTGMFLGLVDDQLTVMKVFEGNPAQKAGIMPGDQLLEVDGLSVKGKSIEEVLPKLRGVPGSKVSIVLKPAGKNIRVKVEIQREEVILSSVPYYGMVDEHFGYIKLTGMTENCSDDVQSAIMALQKQKGLLGIVLDLRNNPGGLFREGTRIANFFIDKGKVLVKVKGRSEETVHYASDKALAPAVPLVVLVNSVTASSAEILCGALQDNDRAVIVGQKTFGKGLVGKVFPMGNGAEAVITIAFYFTPSGRCIQSKNYWSGQNIAGVADSAKTSFVTANGRVVKEAAGIIPDLEMPASQELPVLSFLRDNNYVFKYATEYVLKNPGFVPGRAVNLTDGEYAAFMSGLPSDGINFNSTTSNKLKELKTVAANEGYLNTLDQELTRLEELVQRENKNAFELYKTKIKAMLEQEIAAHYGYERGRIANSLRTDAEVQKAIEVLKNREGMRRMLGMK
jgi:carboxyl-terminal processing protease